MKRRRHTPEQIIRKLREADRLLAEGQEVPEVAKQLEVSEATYHRWRAKYGGLKADDVRRLKELESENARLKRIVASTQLGSNSRLSCISAGVMAGYGPESWPPRRVSGWACRTSSCIRLQTFGVDPAGRVRRRRPPPG